jgi:hypothetical protein
MVSGSEEYVRGERETKTPLLDNHRQDAVS